MAVATGSIAYLGAARFQGFWNADTNAASGSGLEGSTQGTYSSLFTAGDSLYGGYHIDTGLTASIGHYWQVTGSGTTTVDGDSTWDLNDWIIYSGSVAAGGGTWYKLSYEDTIASIVIGDISSDGVFHMTASADKHVLFVSGTSDAIVALSGTDNFTFDHYNGNLILTGNLHISDDKKIYFGSDQNASIEYDEDGTDRVIYSGASLRIADDVKLEFGDESAIHYNEDGDDRLIISGSAHGVVVSGTLVTFDSTIVSASLFHADIITSSFLSAEHNLTLSSSGYISIDSSGGQVIIEDDGNDRFFFDGNNTTFTIYDDADTGDKFSIAITDAGKTTMSTVDDDGFAADLTVSPDGKLLLTGAMGVYLSGSGLYLDSVIAASGTVAGPGSYLGVTEAGQVVLASGGTTISNDGDHRIVTAGGDGTINGEANLTYDGTTFVVNDDARVNDDLPLYFGDDNDAHIKYDEAGSDQLIISGSATGIALSGTLVNVFCENNTNYLEIGAGNTNLTPRGNNLVDTVSTATNTGSVTLNEALGLTNFRIFQGHDSFNAGTAAGRSEPTLFMSGADGIFHFHNNVVTHDDAKHYFGSQEDSYVVFNSAGNDRMVVSGSKSGLELSGSGIYLDAITVTSGAIAGLGSYLGVTDAGQVVLTASSGGTVTISNDADHRLTTAGGDGTISGEANLTYDGTTFVINDDARVNDDLPLYFGDDSDAYIKYNESGNDRLVVSGSKGGVELSGSAVYLDSITVASGAIAGPASYLGVTETGQIVLTASSTAAGAVSAVANGANNRVATFSASDELNGEANLLFDGSWLSITGSVSVSGSLLPSSDSEFDLGSADYRWRNMYTGDLHLKNERGDWTIIEEEDYLTITNNKKGKKYKFVLEEIE